MGSRGPMPESEASKFARGNPGRRPLNLNKLNQVQTAESISISVPDPPGWLDDDAKLVWARLAPHVVSLGLLSDVDVDLFAKVCSLYACGIRLDRVLSEQGIFWQVNGQTVPRPEAKQSRENWRQLERLLNHFGLSPVGRRRLNLDFPQPEPPEVLEKRSRVEEMLRGHRNL